MEKINNFENIDRKNNLYKLKQIINNYSNLEKVNLNQIKDNFNFKKAVVFDINIKEIYFEEKNRLPPIIQKFVNDKDSAKGIRFYYMEDEDGKGYIATGFFGSSTTRDNDIIYNQFLKDKFQYVKIDLNSWIDLID